MSATVVLCAFTEERWEDLSAAVASLGAQTRPPDQVVVVIDHNDSLLERARSAFKGAEVVASTGPRGLSGARNTGVELATGDVVAFLDDDAQAESDWLERLLEPFAEPEVAGVGGWILPRFDGPEPTWFPRSFLWVLGCSYDGLPPDGESIRNPIGASMALRRQMILEAGGFASDLGRIGTIPLGGEETEICMRYARQHPEARFVLARRSMVRHHVVATRLTTRYFARRCYAEGLSKAAIAALAGGVGSLGAERRHAATAMPRELVRSLLALPREGVPAARRAGLVALGAAATLAGLWRGRGSKGRAAREGIDEVVRDPREISPVTLVRVDLDDPTALASVRTSPGARIWMEVLRHHQVVGVLETVADREGISEELVADLARRYEPASSSSWVKLPAELLPRASVIVATIGQRPELLRGTVRSLLDLDYGDFEVIVVDNRPPDRDEDLGLGTHDRLRVLRCPVTGTSAARNYGVEHSEGEIIAFTDDDALVDREWLRALAARFIRDGEVDAIGGMVRPSELDTRPQLWFEEYYGGFTKSFEPQEWNLATSQAEDPLFPYSAGHFGAGVNMAIRRRAFAEVGGFDERLGGGTRAKAAEDLDLFLKVIFAGGTVAFEPSALVRHSHRRTESDFLHQVFTYGIGLTAMFTGLIWRDPRHLWEIARRIPRGVKLMMRPGEVRSPSARPSYPSRTHLYQFAGMAYGPVAYLRSHRQWRRRTGGRH